MQPGKFCDSAWIFCGGGSKKNAALLECFAASAARSNN